jgi:hypothetical protein
VRQQEYSGACPIRLSFIVYFRCYIFLRLILLLFFCCCCYCKGLTNCSHLFFVFSSILNLWNCSFYRHIVLLYLSLKVSVRLSIVDGEQITFEYCLLICMSYMEEKHEGNIPDEDTSKYHRHCVDSESMRHM